MKSGNIVKKKKGGCKGCHYDESDIAILEKMCNEIIEGDDCDLFETLSPYEIALTIKNLIKGYRELEESKITRERVNDIQEETKRIVDKNYIPKSKVKEKIEKLKKEFDFYAGREHWEWQDGEFDDEVCDDLALKIRTLKELMEDK